jgi:UDP-N-acetylglucosamine 1-carboxyvinyltransferase
MAATLAEGITTIDLRRLRTRSRSTSPISSTAMGAKIKGAGTPVITIEGVEKLQRRASTTSSPTASKPAPSWPPPRWPAKASPCAAVRRRTPHGDDQRHLRKAGHQVHFNDAGDACTIHRGDRPRCPTNIVTAPYPGYPTDMQAQMTALFATTPGTSTVVDTIFPQRFMHCAELKRMGADIQVERRQGRHQGRGPAFSAAPVMASDLRASAAPGPRRPQRERLHRDQPPLPHRPRLRAHRRKTRRTRRECRARPRV